MESALRMGLGNMCATAQPDNRDGGSGRDNDSTERLDLLSGVTRLRTDIANEIIVTWDQVGYFGIHADKLNSFQLVLRGPGFTIPAGEGAIGFFYKGMQWETGDASGGSGGFGGTPAAVGFGDGLANGEVLDGSIVAGISGVVNNHHIWFDIVAGVPVVTPPG